MDEAATIFYTLEEISKHDGKQDPRTWIIIKDVVYDVTDYLNDHPGGPELIEEWAGKDATKEFDSFGHSGDAKKELKKHKIGEVVEEERKKKKKKSDKEREATQKHVEIGDSKNLKINRSCFSIVTCGLCG